MIVYTILQGASSDHPDATRGEKYMKKTSFARRMLALALTLILGLGGVLSAFAEQGDTPVRFLMTAGLRYAAPQFRDNYSDAFLLDARVNDLQYEQLDGLMNSMFALGRSRKALGGDYLLIGGGMTYNSESENHEALTARLAQFESESGVKVITVNGPGDLYNRNSATFADGKRVRSLITTTSAMYRDLYADFGPDLAVATYKKSGNSRGSCSYAVDMGSMRLIVIDAAYYADDIMTAAGDKTVTGRIDDQLMVWLQAQCAAAIRAGQTPVGFCGWDLLGGGFDPAGALENGESAGALLADAGMHYFFSAGSGRSDVCSVMSENGEIIYGVSVSNLTSFPNQLRWCECDGKTLTTDIVDVDEVLPVTKRPDADGHVTVYDQPYRVTASLRVQFADYDIARYLTDKFDNFLINGLIPGVQQYQTIENYLQASMNIDAKAWLDEFLGGGVDILGSFAVFDSSNVLNLLNNSILPQLKDGLLKDPEGFSDMVYDGLKSVTEAEVSSVCCTKYLDTYGFGNVMRGGSYGELLLSLAVVSRCGNEDISDDKFLVDVGENLRTGVLVPYIARVLGLGVGRDILLDGILDNVTVQPEYLLFLDDTEDSLGSYIQTGFKYLMAMYRQEPTYAGLFRALISSRILAGLMGEYGSTPEDVLETYIEKYFSGSRAESIGEQLYAYFSFYTSDDDPVVRGDEGTYRYLGPVTPDPARAHKETVSRLTVTVGADPTSEIGLSWYTTTVCRNTHIELYRDGGDFRGGHYIGVPGADAEIDAQEVRVSYAAVDLGIAALGRRTEWMMRHTVKLTGLPAGSDFVCRVGDAQADAWSGDVTFSTADDGRNVTFIHVAETAGVAKSEYASALNVLNCIDSLYPDADFVVHTGNYTVGGDDSRQWSMLLDTMPAVTAGFTFAPAAGTAEKGNAAVAENFLLPTADGANGAYYSFNYNNVHVTVLDMTKNKLRGGLSDEQTAFLREDLAAAGARWKVLAIHGDVFSGAKTADTRNHKTYYGEVTSLADELGIDLVLTGSEGVYTRTDSVFLGKTDQSPMVSYPFDGKYYKTLVKPKGTVYSALGPSGSACTQTVDYESVDTKNGVAARELDSDKPMFTSYTVRGDDLLLRTYTLDGKKATLVDSLLIKKAEPSVLRGDVNSDGKLTAKDARLALRISARLEPNVTDRMLKIADLDGDGKVTAGEARRILRASAKLETL